MIRDDEELKRLVRLKKSDEAYLKSLEAYPGSKKYIKDDMKNTIKDTDKRIRRLL